MEQIFVVTYHHELGENLKVLNKEGHIHILKYNKDLIYPLITTGLSDLKEFYKIPNNSRLVIYYFGNDLFQVKNFSTIVSTSTIPSFHSRSEDPSTTIFFDVTIDADTVKYDDLVSNFIFIDSQKHLTYNF